jgi:hypothetical protein
MKDISLPKYSSHKSELKKIKKTNILLSHLIIWELKACDKIMYFKFLHKLIGGHICPSVYLWPIIMA